MSNTKSTRLLNALLSGEDLSTKQAAKRSGLSPVSVAKAIYNLRTAGFPIYTNKRTTSNGHVVNRYRMGTAPRAVVAAGYLTLSEMGFNPLSN